jgi:hypothetical protein
VLLLLLLEEEEEEEEEACFLNSSPSRMRGWEEVPTVVLLTALGPWVAWDGRRQSSKALWTGRRSL